MRLNYYSLICIGVFLIACGDDDDDDSSSGDRLPSEIQDPQGERFMSAVLADLDGDRDLDLFLGALDRDGIPRDRVLFNDGTGQFELAPDENVPLRFGGDRYGTVQVRADDVDDDGDNDILAAVHGPLPSEDATVMLYLNDGNGVFSDGSTKINYVAPSNGSGGLIIGNLELGDLDDDGDTDFLLTQGGTNNALYLNDGSGNFAQADFAGFDFGFNFAFHVTAGDIDGDNDTDVLALESIFVNEGSTSFSQITTNGEFFYQPMFGAVLRNAGGGNPTIVGVQFVFLDEVGEDIRVFRADNEGIVDITSDIFMEGVNTIHPRNLYVADFDGNGTDDLIIADHGFDNFPFPGAQNTLILQDTDGTLTDASSRLPQVSDFTHDIAIGDIDGDGDIDIYASNLANDGAPQTPYFMINDGNGNFTLEE